MSRRLVLDASAALQAVLAAPAAGEGLDALASASVVLAPDLYSAEVANALWKYVRAGELDIEAAVHHLENAIALVDAFVPTSDLAKEALVAAATVGHSVYDCIYAVLARREGASVLTADRALSSWLEGLQVPATLIGSRTPPASGQRRRQR
jgi:predicted nucleic acid-binding protein